MAVWRFLAVVTFACMASCYLLVEAAEPEAPPTTLKTDIGYVVHLAPLANDAAIGPYDRLPRVFVSSFPGYQAFAAAYGALADE